MPKCSVDGEATMRPLPFVRQAVQYVSIYRVRAYVRVGGRSSVSAGRASTDRSSECVCKAAFIPFVLAIAVGGLGCPVMSVVGEV